MSLACCVSQAWEKVTQAVLRSSALSQGDVATGSSLLKHVRGSCPHLAWAEVALAAAGTGRFLCGVCRGKGLHSTSSAGQHKPKVWKDNYKSRRFP